MDLVMIVPILLVAAATSACGEPARGFQHKEARSKASFGDILKPPPLPPPLSYRGSSGQRVQRQNFDVGYQYPPPPPPPPLPPPGNFRPPAPFHKPYGYNFVPPPQPFLTTPSPSVFQKVQNWLFPPSSAQAAQVSGPTAVANVPPVKKDCNPCNLVPWIPVIRYNPPENLNYRESVNPTYGAPAGTYGPPAISPPPTYRPPQPFYGPSRPQSSSQSPLSAAYEPQQRPFSSYREPSSTYGPPAPSEAPPYTTSSPAYGFPAQQPSDVEIIQQQLARPTNDLKLPKVSYPTGFKNSYGEPITVSYPYNELYPVSATAAESSKIKTSVVSAENVTTNVSLPFSKPSPFTRQPGRGIHTLQPVALPNLSVSPLPPIFNARPFRTNVPMSFTIQSDRPSKDVKIVPSIPVAEFTSSIEYPIKFIQSPIVDVDVPTKSHFNHTKSYRVIPYSDDVFENRPQDASSQASEAHTASASNNDIKETSFESTGTAAGNDINGGFSTKYNFFKESFLSASPVQSVFPKNHKPPIPEDFRGIIDASENELRSEQHLQAIDSPVLYLRPNAPHKDFTSLFSVSSTQYPETSEFEIYDDNPTSSNPQPTRTTEPDFWSTNQYPDTTNLFQSEDQNGKNPKVVQIIIPYTTGNDPNAGHDHGTDESSQWESTNDDLENQGRKVPSYTESIGSLSYAQYSTSAPPMLQSTETITEYYEPPKLSAASILNDLYDVKEPPFDIIELQHNIDGWTEQEFSQHYRAPQKTNFKIKYSKQIPDEYLTTPEPPTTFYTTDDSKMSFFDHEGSSSIQHSVKDELHDSATQRSAKEVNYKDRRTNHKDYSMDSKKPYIYTAASSFRSLSSTPHPWGEIETSISPLTKEKVYVVTARPWSDAGNRSQEWYDGSSFESKKTTGLDNDVSASDNLLFKSPRFSKRPVFSSETGKEAETLKTESSHGLGKSWHQSINALDTNGELRNHSSVSEGDRSTPPTMTPAPPSATNPDEEIITTTAETNDDGRKM